MSALVPRGCPPVQVPAPQSMCIHNLQIGLELKCQTRPAWFAAQACWRRTSTKLPAKQTLIPRHRCEQYDTSDVWRQRLLLRNSPCLCCCKLGQRTTTHLMDCSGSYFTLQRAHAHSVRVRLQTGLLESSTDLHIFQQLLQLSRRLASRGRDESLLHPQEMQSSGQFCK